MRTIINCAHAKGVALDKGQAVYECRNPKAGNHLEMINDKKCAGCKERVPIDKKQAPAIYREEKNRQITFTEWVSARGEMKTAGTREAPAVSLVTINNRHNYSSSVQSESQ